MYQINQIKLPPNHRPEDIMTQIRKVGVQCRPDDVSILKKSLDARKKQDIHYLYSVQIQKGTLVGKKRSPQVILAEEKHYQLPQAGTTPMKHRPIIVGTGPAGLFAGLMLAEQGYAPILIERGAPVEERTRDVSSFWAGGPLKTESNVQFGEGGAGTFSDGKLNTQVKDQSCRIRKVLEGFVEAGADESILYWHKPHIGTDVLQIVVKNIRQKIQSLGGEFHFHTKLTDLMINDGQITGVILEKNEKECVELPAESVILAIGHSARDTFAMLEKHPILMHAKSFAVGLRIEHPQTMINLSQYGVEQDPFLPTADYKLTAQTSVGRGVYSFCMCPGGQVVNASSEPGRLAVNGMSHAARDGRNANSALIVTVTPEDYPGEGALAGIAFQRKLEELAYQRGEGAIPVQMVGDFKNNTISQSLGDVVPDLCGAYHLTNLRQILPDELSQALIEAIGNFGQRIQGFDRPDAVFSGVESRTSSPVRLERNECFESSLKGLFPCGEGAGYAGGITSAAVDGIKIAEEIIRRYQPWT